MSLTTDSLLATLKELHISFQLHEHPAVFTTQDVTRLEHPLAGQDTKNLFLRDDKSTVFLLVCVKAETRVNLKELGRKLGVKGITFGSPEQLSELLGVTPGSVCLFALGNDSQKRVRGYIDTAIDQEGEMQNHPLINTATVVLKVRDMMRAIESLHQPLIQVEIPSR